jgi:hypothetical protein
MYLHDVGDRQDSFTMEDLKAGCVFPAYLVCLCGLLTGLSGAAST